MGAAMQKTQNMQNIQNMQKMNDTLHSLLSHVEWSEVAFALRRYFREEARELEPFRRVFERLRRMTPEPTSHRVVFQRPAPDLDSLWERDQPSGVGCADEAEAVHEVVHEAESVAVAESGAESVAVAESGASAGAGAGAESGAGAGAESGAGAGADRDRTSEQGLWSLALRRWGECLGMRVPLAARITYMDAGVVAHCLWAMTRTGFGDRDGWEWLADRHRPGREPPKRVPSPPGTTRPERGAGYEPGDAPPDSNPGRSDTLDDLADEDRGP
jgi:hypothetical protein